MEPGNGLATGVNIRLEATATRDSPSISRIGRQAQINESVHIGAIEQVVIGDHALNASRIFISDHNRGNYQIPDAASSPDILPCVTTEDGALVGANSVIAHDIAANSIAVGNPACMIRMFGASTQT